MLNGAKVVLILAVSAGAVAGLTAGVLLGGWLGRVGAFGFLREILRLPWVLLKAPGQFANRWKMWAEWRARRKIERIRFRNQMKELKGRISAYHGEIRKTQAEIRRTRWKFREPEPPSE